MLKLVWLWVRDVVDRFFGIHQQRVINELERETIRLGRQLEAIETQHENVVAKLEAVSGDAKRNLSAHLTVNYALMLLGTGIPHNHHDFIEVTRKR